MTASLADLARAYGVLHPLVDGRTPFPPTPQSICRINEVLQIKLPESLLWFAANTSVCDHWLASLGENFDSHNHILRVVSRVRRIRRRVIGGHGRWEYVKPAGFVPFSHGYDKDYDCIDSSGFDASTGEYEIQYWSPPRIFGEHRFKCFPEYIEWHIRAWANDANLQTKDKVLSILGTE